MKMFRSAFALAAAVMFCQASPPADAQPNAIPRTTDGKPDFSGFFDIQYTPNMALGKEDAIPYTPAGKPPTATTTPRTIPPPTAGSPASRASCSRPTRPSSSKPPIAW